MRPFCTEKADTSSSRKGVHSRCIKWMQTKDGVSPLNPLRVHLLAYSPHVHQKRRCGIKIHWWRSHFSQIPCFRGSERRRIWLRKGLEFLKVCVFDLSRQCYSTRVLLARRGNNSMYFSGIHYETDTSMLSVWHLCPCVSSARLKVLTKVSARSFR